MTKLFKIKALALACALIGGVGFIGAAAVPALATPQCASNANIWHVHSRLNDAIEQLNHDRHDYGGHRVAAVNDLSGARNQLAAARGFAIHNDGANPGCFVPAVTLDEHAFESEIYGQGASDNYLLGVNRWVNRLIAQLSEDEREYGGHREIAISDLRAGQSALHAAEQFARSRGF